MSAKLLQLSLLGLLGLSLVAPFPLDLKKHYMDKLSLNETERAIVQRCLYYGADVAGYLFAGFPTAFCARLYNPTSEGDGHDFREAAYPFSPREYVMRKFFYLETAQLWSYFLDLDYCHFYNGPQTADHCRPQFGMLRYEGLFKEDFTANRYLQLEKMADALERYRPALRRAEHCFHLHQLVASRPKPFYQATTGRYDPCRRFSTLAWSVDQLPAGVSAKQKAAWKLRAADRHFELRVTPDLVRGDERMSWAQMEEQIYQGLYNASAHIFGTPVASQQDRQLQDSILFQNWFSDTLGSELTAVQRRARDHLKSNKIVDKAYDCLKFHRFEEKPWCNRLVGQLDENLDVDLKDNFATSNFKFDEVFMGKVRDFIAQERQQELEVINDVSAHLLAFLALPERIIEYCTPDFGDDNKAASDPNADDFDEVAAFDEDCLRDGLFEPFFTWDHFPGAFKLRV